MDKNRDQFTPEQIDEQIDQLLVRSNRSLADTHLLNILQRMYQEDERSLEKVWYRLEAENSSRTGVEQQQRDLNTARARPAGAMVSECERDRRMFLPHQKSITRQISLIAAAVVAALLIGSMLWLLTISRQEARITPSSSQVAGVQGSLGHGIYFSNQGGLFRMNTQTRQVVWKQSLSWVTKVIPADNALYVLQSKPYATETCSVLAIDVHTGHVLWQHTLLTQKRGENAVLAVASDLVLANTQLYVGVNTLGQGSNKDAAGEIVVLNTSDGHQINTYPATSYVHSLVVGDGVLGVATDRGVQVYSPQSGKFLWQAPGNEAALSLQIVDHLLYASFTTSGEPSGTGQSSIAVYNVSTGNAVWKSPSFPGDALDHFTVEHHIVYFGTTITKTRPFTGTLYAYDVQQNTLLWMQGLKQGVQYAPIVMNGLVYVATYGAPETQASVVALHAVDGKILWENQLERAAVDDFSLSKGILYVGNNSASASVSAREGSIYALNPSNGKIVWEDSQHGTAKVIVPTE